jgi:hypothetical protein
MNLISLIGNTNQRMGVHGPLNISEVGSGAMEEYKHPLLTSHTRREPYFHILLCDTCSVLIF